MHSILDLFEKTFEDRILSTAEKKALHEIIGEKNLQYEQIGFIRNKIFEFARKELHSLSAVEVLEWVQQANKILLRYQKEQHKEEEVYFSPGDDCRQAIIHLLQQARQNLDICVFTISDDLISNAILNAKNRGVQIRIISDDDKSFDKGSDIAALARQGIPIKVDNSPNHMHHKFVLADQKKVLTGSYNWTRSAAVHNFENIIISYKPAVIQLYKKEFERLWDVFDVLRC